ncbi:hypothetical protein LB507_011306, partial [Fusarium sp. FIESC RH6]
SRPKRISFAYSPAISILPSMHPANVFFQPTNQCCQQPAERANIIDLVVAKAPPGASHAIVVNG